MNMNKQKIMIEASQLINELESLSAFVEIARQRALEVYTLCEQSYSGGLDFSKMDPHIAAAELPRVANDCRVRAARLDYAIQLAAEVQSNKL